MQEERKHLEVGEDDVRLELKSDSTAEIWARLSTG